MVTSGRRFTIPESIPWRGHESRFFGFDAPRVVSQEAFPKSREACALTVQRFCQADLVQNR
jgi:hypothetical protein